MPILNKFRNSSNGSAAGASNGGTRASTSIPRISEKQQPTQSTPQNQGQ
jgi:hypothetical protein